MNKDKVIQHVRNMCILSRAIGVLSHKIHHINNLPIDLGYRVKNMGQKEYLEGVIDLMNDDKKLIESNIINLENELEKEIKGD